MEPWMWIGLGLLLALIASWFVLPGLWARGMLALGRRAGGLHSHFADIGGQRWHYLEGGRAELPVLVCLHGFAADADHWVMVSRGLEKNFHLLAPDLPGFGESDPPTKPATATAQAEALAGFLDQMGVAECLIAGNSMGGWVATAYAQRYPERVRGIWLLAPLGVEESAKSAVLQAVDSGENSPLEFNGIREFREKVMKPMFYRNRAAPAPLVRFLAQRALPRRALYQDILETVRQQSPPLERMADDVKVPVFLQWGDNDQVTDPSGAEPLARHFQQVELDRIPHCGHLPMLERPQRVLQPFQKFVESKGLTTGPPSARPL